jgi:hypothetical protein
VAEQNKGKGVIQGIIDPPGSAKPIKRREIPPLEQAAQEEYEPGRPMPEPKMKSTPEQFGKFDQKRK